jgi:molybdopterin molybdotransferase
VLAADAVSPVALPPWDNASMDGIAVRAADVLGARAGAPVALRLAGAVAAGRAWADPIAPGTAVRIATGAPVPRGADAVVRVEDLTFEGDGTVRVRDDRDARVGEGTARRNVRPRGEDVAEGAVAVPAGATLGAAALGVLASIGGVDVAVTRRPRVAVVASGDELVPLGDVAAVRAGRGIVSSNSVTLAALVREAGGEPVDLGVAPDDPDALRARIAAALEAGCDVVLTTGGVSVGERDHARDAIGALGGACAFWRVRMRRAAAGAGTLPPPGATCRGSASRQPRVDRRHFELFARPLLRRPARRRPPLPARGARARGEPSPPPRRSRTSCAPRSTWRPTAGCGAAHGAAGLGAPDVAGARRRAAGRPESVDALPAGRAGARAAAGRGCAARGVARPRHLRPRRVSATDPELDAMDAALAARFDVACEAIDLRAEAPESSSTSCARRAPRR